MGVEVGKVLLLLPVDQEVVGHGAEVVDKQKNGEQHETELKVEDDHEGVIVAHPLGDGVGQQQVNGLLELVEAEAVGTNSEEPDPKGDAPVTDGPQYENEDNFEHDVGVVLVIVGIVLHVLVEVDDETHQYHHVEHDERRSHYDVDGVCARWRGDLGRVLLLQAQVRHLERRTWFECHWDWVQCALVVSPVIIAVRVQSEHLHVVEVCIGNIDIIENVGGGLEVCSQAVLHQVKSEALEIY